MFWGKQVEIGGPGIRNSTKSSSKLKPMQHFYQYPEIIAERWCSRRMLNGLQVHCSFRLGTELDVSPGAYHIWIWDWIASGSRILDPRLSCKYTQDQIASEAQSDLGKKPNHILVWNQISFGTWTELQLSLGSNHIWVWDQIAFRSETESHLGQEPYRTCVGGLICVWVQDQIPFWSVMNIRAWDQITFPFGT